MATPAQHLIQDQNLNVICNGTTPGGKTDVARADKRGGPGRRKPLSNISNSGTPSLLHPVKKYDSMNVISIEKDSFTVKTKLSKAPEKGKVGGRKPLGELTNKPPSKQVPNRGRKLNAVAEENGNVPSCMVEERFLHNHQECIKAQTKAVDMDYFLKSVGLSNDVAAQPSTRRAVALSSKKKPENTMKHFKMEMMPEHLFEDQVIQCRKSELPGNCSPACRSPQSPKAPYMSWEDDKISDLMLIATPKPM